MSEQIAPSPLVSDIFASISRLKALRIQLAAHPDQSAVASTIQRIDAEIALTESMIATAELTEAVSKLDFKIEGLVKQGAVDINANEPVSRFTSKEGSPVSTGSLFGGSPSVSGIKSLSKFADKTLTQQSKSFESLTAIVELLREEQLDNDLDGLELDSPVQAVEDEGVAPSALSSFSFRDRCALIAIGLGLKSPVDPSRTVVIYPGQTPTKPAAANEFPLTIRRSSDNSNSKLAYPSSPKINSAQTKALRNNAK